MSNLEKFAEHELKLVGAFDDGLYGGMLGTAIMDLVRKFGEQGHSGMSASIVSDAFKKITTWEPLTPLTGADDEWNEVGDGMFQNKRCPRVFKDASGAYDCEGRVFRERDGSAFTSRDSRVTITFPYYPTTEFVDVDENHKPIPAPLSFSELAAVNIRRCRRWHDPNSWDPQMWGLAACGEAGEMANALKKLKRHDERMQQNGVTTSREELIKAVAMEIGDVVVYLDLLAQRMNLRLEDCVRDTFNRISVREDFPERL